MHHQLVNLNLIKCISSCPVQATCPPAGQRYLSPQQVSEIVEKQLAAYGKESCSEAFLNSLRKFFEVQQDKLDKKIKFVEDIGWDDKSQILEEVTHKTSGITEKQLEVIAVYSLHFLLTKTQLNYSSFSLVSPSMLFSETGVSKIKLTV